MSQVPSLQTGWCWHLPSGLLRELNKANRVPPTELDPQGPVSVRYLYPLRSSLFSLLATLVSHSLFLACFLLNNSTKSFFRLLWKSFTKDKEDHWSKAGTSEAHSFTQVWASACADCPSPSQGFPGRNVSKFWNNLHGHARPILLSGVEPVFLLFYSPWPSSLQL